MKFSISRDALLKPLNLVAGVVERRHTLPVLSNVLISLDQNRLSLTGTDLEVELVGHLATPVGADGGEVTVPARKLADICKALPEGSELDFSLDEHRLQVRCGRSRFVLSTLPAGEFPNLEQAAATLEFRIKQGQLRRLIDRTAFSMAQQDVRYYLNGMLFEVNPKRLRAVATDGHRLAMATLDADLPGVRAEFQAILPRKGVLELQRLLQDPDADVLIELGHTLFRAVTSDFSFMSKLIDGKFPDYERVLPSGPSRALTGSRHPIKDALSRSAILSNEKLRGVRLVMEADNLEIQASNPEQEEAEETVQVDYGGERVEIGFNVGYLIEVLAVLTGESVRLEFVDGSKSVLIEDPQDDGAVYVVMPMRL